MTFDRGTGPPTLQNHDLVCDVGGVLLEDGLHRVLARAAKSGGADPDVILRAYRERGLRDQLFTGAMTTQQFWSAVEDLVGPGCQLPEDPDAAVVAGCVPLPALSAVRSLASQIWLATNHRHEWLLPALRAARFDVGPAHVMCSSLLEACKPGREFYQLVQSRLTHTGEAVVYVDDQDANFAVPIGLGWRVVHFAEGHDDVTAIMALLV